MEITDLKKYHKNPRKITAKQHEFLEESMKEFGDLSGVIVNKRTGELIGGNQRTSIFQKHAAEVQIVRNETLETPDAQGTLATGYIVFRGSKFNYREVDWDTEKEARANIIANKAGGFWDNDLLANEFDEELLMSAGFEDFELGMFDGSADDGTERSKDSDTLEDTLNTYLDGSIKQIVLYFKKEDYDGIIERMEKLQESMGASDFTEVFTELLKRYENTQGN